MGDLKCWNGIWLPSTETHMTAWMLKANQRDAKGRLCYQKHKVDAALALCRQFRRAVDVGAHCGLWSMQLVDRFQHVDAIEPVALHCEAFRRNVQGDFTLHQAALGEADGWVSMKSDPHSTGDTMVGGAGDIPMRRLDDLVTADDVDFLKLDCEGYELHVLKGGKNLLERCKPLVVVEQKPGKSQEFGLPEIGAVDYLQSLGARVVCEISGDYFLAW